MSASRLYSSPQQHRQIGTSSCNQPESSVVTSDCPGCNYATERGSSNLFGRAPYNDQGVPRPNSSSHHGFREAAGRSPELQSPELAPNDWLPALDSGDYWRDVMARSISNRAAAVPPTIRSLVSDAIRSVSTPANG